MTFLQRTKSPRADEFRAKCDERFGLSTGFKTGDEKAKLKEEVMKRPGPVKEEEQEQV